MSTAHKLSARAVTLWNKGADARDPESACFTSSSNSGNLPPNSAGVLNRTESGAFEFPYEAVHVDFALRAAA